jgi:peroxiredoxin
MALHLAYVPVEARQVPERFPDFTLKDLRGKQVSSAEFSGKVLLVNFWVTTCPPCKKEMPMLQSLHRKYAAHGLVVIGVSLDEKPGTAAAFARSLRITYPLLIHPTLMTDEAQQQHYGILGLPTTYIVDRAGVVRKKVVGFAYREDLEKSIQELIRR